ncbi:MAG: ABC transporter permease [Methanoregulaceae archaeon]|nr:ABC transporter permease [Methanoregulaceae archaeon]
MQRISTQAVYMLWLREMKRTWRAKSRMIGSLIMPLFFLLFLGTGFRRAAMPGIPPGVDYITFLIPGVVGMSLLFSSMFGGLQVLWDKEFGFLKEIMVTPVSRLSIVLGRMAGGSTVALLQSFAILFMSMAFGFRIHSPAGLVLAVGFMFLIAFTFIGLGLAFASRMKDMHGFQLVMNFVVFPIFFLSGALYPIQGLPKAIKPLVYLDPLTYGVDGLRGSLLGSSVRSLALDFAILAVICAFIVTLGSILFESSDVGQ